MKSTDIPRVATFNRSSMYPNRLVAFRDEKFLVEGVGEIDAPSLLEFDSRGELQWGSVQVHNWVIERAGAESAPKTSFAQGVTSWDSTLRPPRNLTWLVVLVMAVILAFPVYTLISKAPDWVRSASVFIESASEESKDNETQSQSTPTQNAMHSIGDNVAVGMFTYIVNSTDTTKELGASPFNETTEGEFLLVNVTITNNDSEGRVMDSSMFKLLDSKGNEYDPDSSAFMYLDDSDSLFLENVNPGLSRTGSVVFEIPEGLKELSLEVDSGVLLASGKTVVIKLDR